MRRALLSWGPLCLWALALLFLGSRPPNQLPHGGLWSLPGADKLAHALLYGVLGYLVGRALPLRGAARMALLGALAGLGWGILDEWVQSHVPGRTPAWADLLADMLGAGAGGWLRGRRKRS